MTSPMKKLSMRIPNFEEICIEREGAGGWREMEESSLGI